MQASTFLTGGHLQTPRVAPATGRPGRRNLVVANEFNPGQEKAMFGEDFGARDPTRGELETNFSDKVWFNWSTEHIIKPPEKMKKVLGLSAKNCYPFEDLSQLEEGEINRLKFQVLGWRVEKEGETFTLVQDYKVKDRAAGATLTERFATVSTEQKHATYSVSQPDDSTVKVVLKTKKEDIDGLTMNDFILAMKLNDTPLADLAPPKRKRYWA